MDKIALTEKVKELRELKRMQEELQAEITAIEDGIKLAMTESGVYEMFGIDCKVSWKEYTSSRVDVKALQALFSKEDLQSYMKTTVSRKFLVA